MSYSLENAQKFKWSSVTGSLNPERVSHLENHLVGSTVLDAGCGGGAYVEFLSQQGLQVTGVEQHEQFLQVAKENNRVGTYVQGDLTNLPFPDQTFDCTYCFDVLEHTDDLAALRELARVTKRRLILTVPKEDEVMHRFNLTFLHYQDKTHLRNYTEHSLKELSLKLTHSKLTVFPELAIPARWLVLEMIDFQGSAPGIPLFLQRAFNSLLMRLLDRVAYKQVYTSLVAVIDL